MLPDFLIQRCHRLHPILLMLLFFRIFTSFAQPVADFDALVKTGCSPLQVTFINLSAPATGLTYKWILGNGNISEQFEPFAIYTNAGHYDVTLIVSDGILSDTLVKTNFITAYQNPLADFQLSASPIGCAPYSLKFENTSVPGDAPLTYWAWDFGDGNISNEISPVHIYNFAGTFNVSLLITDSNGCAGSALFENLIQIYKPVSYFTGNTTSSCSGELTVSFTNLSEGSGVLSYNWNFGDSTVSAAEEPVHTYIAPGHYTVELITTDNYGCSDTLTRHDYIKITETSASFSINRDTVCKNEIINFLNASQNATQYEWRFGDGSVSNLQNPQHYYSNSGDYLVVLKVTKNGQCADSISMNINIENIIADFNADQNFGCELPFYVQYSDNSLNAISWDWRFGSRHRSILQNPADTIWNLATVNFQQAFSDTLIVTSPHDCRDTIIADTSITIVLPRLHFSPDLNGPYGCVPLELNYINQSIYETDQDQFASWNWEYGNGNNSQNWNGFFIYNQPGVYLVTFSVVTEKGCSASAITSVTAGTQQSPDFTINAPDSVCASDTIQFMNLSYDHGLINYYRWDFGDGTDSDDENPSHSFHDTGYVSVTLSAFYNGCGTAINKHNLLYIKGPVSSFWFNYECQQPFDYAFLANIKDADSFHWDFGDQSPEIFNMQPAVHSFDSSGNYYVNLNSANSITGCFYQETHLVKARKIIADFTLSDSVGCSGDIITCNGSVSHDEAYDNWLNLYKWYFSDTGENITTSSFDGIITHLFNTMGNHYIKLHVQDINGCIDTKIKPLKIYQPLVDFTANYLTGCLPADFSFSDNTVSDTTVTTYYWTFGDSLISNEQNPIHQYQNFGIYDISLTVTDTLGCYNTMLKNDYISAVSPDPGFLATDPDICIGDSVFFLKDSQSEIVSYLWNFGDGITSTAESPAHVYADTGSYTVSLSIIDDHGCDSTGSNINYITVQKPPIANFMADILNAECYPALINFTDMSESNHPGSWMWIFGDNLTASQLQNPAHTYCRPGIYDVTLIASTTNGCSDTLVKLSYVTIKGPWADLISPDTVCHGDSVVLIAADKINVYSLKWDLGNGLTGFSDTVTTVYNNYGYVYPAILLYSDSSHTCDKVISDSINVFEVISNFMINNGVNYGCTPLEITLSDISANANSIYWYINNTFVSESGSYTGILTTPGSYRVEQVIYNNFGCYDSSQKIITVFPLPSVDISADTLICRGNAIQLFAQGGSHYTWQPDKFINDTDIFNPVVQPDSSIRYYVSVKDSNSCKKDTSVFIQIFQVPVISMRDTSIVIGEEVVLNAYNPEIGYYNWFAENSLSCLDCPYLRAHPLEPTEYTVSVKDTNNCFTVNYHVFIDIMKKYSVDVPELFTPNGDGKNDYILVRGWGIIELLEFRIFNRFGEMVFESKDLGNGWDGSYKGASQNIETFTYIVKVLTYNNDILSKKGFIKLVR
ncbi:MAG: PKD domain-containing protein [Bacteroidia bacterium]|nr:PKD domain-containing protein [Bacteroidia bacterium]